MPSERFIAHSRVMRALIDQIRRFARADSNVLVAGETGTGKNAVARELHARGPRARRPFVTIDCASLSPSLIDSELFGHERGSFTGAAPGRLRGVKSMLLNILLDERGDETVDRFTRVAARADRSS